MIGFVLEREGTALAGDPGALIERYLADCLGRGDAQDAAQPVLDTLITSAGTREPRTEAAVAEAAGLEAWQARATLSTLERDGLVRPLEGTVWEISHDFLARMLGRMLGQVKMPWFGRAQTGRLVVAGLGWLVVAGMAMPLWPITFLGLSDVDGITTLAPPTRYRSFCHRRRFPRAPRHPRSRLSASPPLAFRRNPRHLFEIL